MVYVYAQIIDINYGSGIYYRSCEKCKKRIVEMSLVCSKCGIKNIKENYEYLFRIELTDGTGILHCRVLGKVGEQLVSKKANEIAEMANQKLDFKPLFENLKQQVFFPYAISLKETFVKN